MYYMFSGTQAIAIRTADLWFNLKKCIAILKPFEEIWKDISSANATNPTVIPLIYTLKNH